MADPTCRNCGFPEDRHSYSRLGRKCEWATYFQPGPTRDALAAQVREMRETMEPFVRDGDTFITGDCSIGEEVVHATEEDVKRARAALAKSGEGE